MWENISQGGKLVRGENIKCSTSKCVHFNDYVIENCFAFAINTWVLLFPIMHMLSSRCIMFGVIVSYHVKVIICLYKRDLLPS